MKTELEEIKAMVDKFNAEHPVGTPVSVKLADGGKLTTKTRTTAAYLYEEPVVWIEGFDACVDLREVEVSTDTLSDSQD